MKISIEVLHRITGRARLRIESPYPQQAFFALVEVLLYMTEDVGNVETNLHARSVTIHLRKGANLEQVLETFRTMLFKVANDPTFDERLEAVSNAQEYPRRPSQEIDRCVPGNGNALYNTVLGPQGFKRIAPLAGFTAGLSLLVLAPAMVPPAWLVLFAFSFTSWHQLNPNACQDAEQPLPSLYRDIRDQVEHVLESGQA